MASFIYLYSKFTEEFLLLTAAGIFSLLSVYCYTWVVKKRRLGAARDQVPAGMVKVYLSQLINEAQFVRTQLFGLAGGTGNPDDFAAHFKAAPASTSHASETHSDEASSGVSADLMERLKALEKQLADKESMVVNINVEKTKLLEEVENLKQNQKVTGAAATGNNAELLQKMKTLEERLEEYALFEDDLANLKRLQQENAQLKKRIDERGGSAGPQVDATPTIAAAPPIREEPKIEPVVAAAEPAGMSLDQNAIDALLDGTPATPPTPTTPTAEPVIAAAPSAPTKTDDFENLVDKVEDSLVKPEAVQAAAAPSPAPANAAGEKTDEELLKEFENLLNS